MTKKSNPGIIGGIDTERYGIIQENDVALSIKENNKPIHQQVNEMCENLRQERMKEAEYDAGEAPDQVEEKIKRYGEDKIVEEAWSEFEDEICALYKIQNDNYESTVDRTKLYKQLQDTIDKGRAYFKLCKKYKGFTPPTTEWHPDEPTTILSKAIEQVEQMGNYKVMMALVDLNKGDKPKEERLYTFTDIKSKKLREVIYKEMEKILSNKPFHIVRKYTNVDVIYEEDTGVLHICAEEDGKDVYLGLFYVREEG